MIRLFMRMCTFLDDIVIKFSVLPICRKVIFSLSCFFVCFQVVSKDAFSLQVLLVIDKRTQETFVLKVSIIPVLVWVFVNVLLHSRCPGYECEVCQKPLCVTGVIDSNGPVSVSSSALRCETCARC